MHFIDMYFHFNDYQISAVILPSLRRIHGNIMELDNDEYCNPEIEMCEKKRTEENGRHSNMDLKREDECGICLEPCTKMVLPNCCHALCINCYHDW